MHRVNSSIGFGPDLIRTFALPKKKGGGAQTPLLKVVVVGGGH